MALEDARRRVQARTSAPAQSKPPLERRWYGEYTQAVAALTPYMDRLTIALSRRVRLKSLRDRFERERELAFLGARSPKRRATFESEHNVTDRIRVRFMGSDSKPALLTAHDSVQMAGVHELNLLINLTTWRWDVRVVIERPYDGWPSTFSTHVLLSPATSTEEVVAMFADITSQNAGSKTVVDAALELVVILADYYNIPYSEVEST